MDEAQLLIGFLAAIAVLAGLARAVGLPYPVVLVVGGLGIALIPGVPHVRIDPDLVLLIFVPPLVYSASFLSSARELRAQARPILLLAVGLVLATIAAVAAVAHLALGIPWAPAFVLGAVLGPTDPISATTILARLGAPRRLSTILEGEALVNDGTALVAYKIALGAVGAASFSAFGAAGEFALASAGGIAVGLGVGWLAARVRRSLDEAEIEITVSLLTPFVAYIPAEQFGLSGVLAAVAAGLYVGAQSERILTAQTRLRYHAFWEGLTFLLNSVLFLLIGLELQAVLPHLDSGAAGRLAVEAALVTATVIAVRFAWIFAAAPLVGAVVERPATKTLGERLVLGSSGMRGAISLAAVLAVPLTLGGAPFPHRAEIIFLAYVAVVVTLVAPGISMPALVRRLGLAASEQEAAIERRREASATLARAALARLDELAEREGVPVASLTRMRARYDKRLSILEAAMRGEPGLDEDLAASASLHRDLLAAERAVLAELRRSGELPAHIARAIERDLDLEEAGLRA